MFVCANYAGGGQTSPGLSGGDRIAIEVLRRSEERVAAIRILTGRSGSTMYQRYIAANSNIDFLTTARSGFTGYGLIGIFLFFIESFVRGVLAVRRATEQFGRPELIFSASDFLPDVLPGVIVRRRNHDVTWIATFYLRAPHPFSRNSPYRGLSLFRGLLFFLAQATTLPLIRKYADGILVTSSPDKHYLEGQGVEPGRILVIKGGVDFTEVNSAPDSATTAYEAVYIGRLHPQKGVLELLDIWVKVVAEIPSARLALIGDGALEGRVRRERARLGLEKNVELLGFLDGKEKFSIIKRSKVVVHPAIYDSGGMAMCEAMACRLPGVSFDLPALKTYYPHGVIKVPCFDKGAFAKCILRLLEDGELYETVSEEALSLALEWDWNRRTTQFWDFIQGVPSEQGL